MNGPAKLDPDHFGPRIAALPVRQDPSQYFGTEKKERAMVGMQGERVYRAVFATEIETVLAPVASPEGRFHHAGQAALYLSETVEGVEVAMATYLRADDPPRLVVPLAMSGGRLFDARREGDLRDLGLAPGAGSVRWQEDRAAGRRPLSWALADAVRATGADGMLYASRKRPDLTHLALFRWNRPGALQLACAGAPLPFAG